MSLLERFRRKKSRRYPIKRDERGRSLRERCFELFEQGQRPAVVAKELNMKEATTFRYFTDWRRLGRNFEGQLAFVKQLFDKAAPERDKNIGLFAKMLGIEKGEFEDILDKPHGLKQLMAKRFRFPIMEDADHKRHIALQLGILIADHLINEGGKFQDVYLTLKTLLQKNVQFRQDKKDAVKAENQTMVFVHRILDLDLENERKSAVKRDGLSEEEIVHVQKLEIERTARRMETEYWKRVTALMLQGLDRDQAREKMYQDLLDSGNIEEAKALRIYQDFVHPLKSPQQSTPPSPFQPPQAK